MTNDLNTLRDAWGEPEPPSRAAFSAARAALLERAGAGGGAPAPEHLRRPVRWRRAGWLATGLGLTASAAAAAVVVGSGTMAPVGTVGSSPPAARLSGQQILLAAATTAATRPEGSGTYWHIKTVARFTNLTGGKNGAVQEAWTRRDGQQWQSLRPGTVVKVNERTRFWVAGVGLSFGQLQKLPADPAALKAWVISAAKANRSEPALTASQADLFAIDDGLVDLLYAVPAPPAVRAAAFRALALFPGVKSLGAVDGGQGLLMVFRGGQQDRLIIDPATSMVRSESAGATIAGKLVSKGYTVVASGWTDTLP
jgi:hypothetical protein